MPFCKSILKSFTALRTEVYPLASDGKDVLAPSASLSVNSFRYVVKASEVLTD
jgi:hypothetical protein